jgi:large conductance mechanosensitive channel
MRQNNSMATGFVKDFQDFVIKGNIFDLAIGVIMGTAFAKVVDSLIKDIIVPLILAPALQVSGAKDLESWTVNSAKIGLFLSNIISFILIALIIFLMVRAMAKFKRKEQKVEAADTRECPHCLSTIALAATRCPYCTSEVPPLS